MAASIAPAMLWVSGCTVGGALPPATAIIDPAWDERQPVTAIERREDWWRALGDPMLDALVTRAIDASPDLQTAAVKVLQAEAQARVTGAASWPQFGLNGGLNAFRIPPELADRLQGIDPTILQDSLTLQGSWELDFWGKERSATRADRLSALNLRASYNAALVSLLGDLATTYVNMRVLEARLALARRTEASQAHAAVLAETRHREGKSDGQDPAQAQTSAAQARSQTASLEAQTKQQRHALALLAGLTDGEMAPLLAQSGRIPVAPAAPDSGIPRDLLRNRADVVAAELTARAQFERLKSAKASLYPSFSLSGALGLSATTIGASTLLDMFNWNKRSVSGGVALSVPLFNHGKLVSQVRVQDAAVEEALLAYEKSVLAAQRDVRDALVQFDTSQRSSSALTDAGRSSATALRIAAARYREGASDHQSLLSAEFSDLAIRDAQLQAQGNAALSYIALNRALGAGPKAAGLPEQLSPRVRARMTKRTRWGKLLPSAASPSPGTTERPR